MFVVTEAEATARCVAAGISRCRTGASTTWQTCSRSTSRKPADPGTHRGQAAET